MRTASRPRVSSCESAKRCANMKRCTPDTVRSSFSAPTQTGRFRYAIYARDVSDSRRAQTVPRRKDTVLVFDRVSPDATTA
jgi:hypothetical protein